MNAATVFCAVALGPKRAAQHCPFRAVVYLVNYEHAVQRCLCGRPNIARCPRRVWLPRTTSAKAPLSAAVTVCRCRACASKFHSIRPSIYGSRVCEFDSQNSIKWKTNAKLNFNEFVCESVWFIHFILNWNMRQKQGANGKRAPICKWCLFTWPGVFTLAGEARTVGISEINGLCFPGHPDATCSVRTPVIKEHTHTQTIGCWSWTKVFHVNPATKDISSRENDSILGLMD